MQKVESHLGWVSGTEIRFSRRVSNTFNPWIIYPSLPFDSLTTAILSVGTQNLNVVLICISLISNDEHYFKCLSFTFISFLKLGCCFLDNYFGILVYYLFALFCLLCISNLLMVQQENFPQFCWLPFYSVDDFF